MSGSPEMTLVDVFNEIINELNSLIAQRELDEFTKIRTLQELEKRAIALAEYDLAFCYSALGSISAARGSVDDMHKQHKKSLQLSSEPLIHLNYAISLKNLGELEKALGLAREIFDEHPDNFHCPHLLAIIYYDMENEKQFLRFANLYKKMTNEVHYLMKTYEQERDDSRELSRECLLLSTPALERTYQ